MYGNWEDDVVKQLQQWFSLHDMGEEGQITVEAAQMLGTMGLC